MTGAVNQLAVSIVLGASLGAGILCLLCVAPRWRAPRLDRRIAPYVRDVGDSEQAPPVWGGAWDGAERLRLRWLAASVAHSAGARMSALLGGAQAIERRLTQAGVARSVDGYRAVQLGWMIAGLAAGALATIVLALSGRSTPALVVLAPLGAMLGALSCNAILQSRARRRMSRLAEELPVVLEFLALCLAAGEGLLDALRRVSDAGGGELSAEVRTVLVEVRTGAPLADSLTTLSRRIALPSLTRATDQLVGSLERGAPLARVLQAQADDAHEEAKQALIERAGRSEILMLIPLVFLILPLSVLFAIYPGIFILRLGLT